MIQFRKLFLILYNNDKITLIEYFEIATQIERDMKINFGLIL